MFSFLSRFLISKGDLWLLFIKKFISSLEERVTTCEILGNQNIMTIINIFVIANWKVNSSKMWLFNKECFIWCIEHNEIHINAKILRNTFVVDSDGWKLLNLWYRYLHGVGRVIPNNLQEDVISPYTHHLSLAASR